MSGEVIYIIYSYVFGLYLFLLAPMTSDHNHGCHRKYSFCLFITSKSIHLKYVNYGPNFKASIYHDMCYILGLNFVSYRMWNFSTYFEDGRVLESVGIISSQDSLDLLQSQMELNTIYYFKFQTCNLSLQPDYNRCKLIIQVLWFSNSIPYNHVS